MAGGKERALRAQIRSVNSTKKIMKAMELIAASRIVKAVGRIAQARTYYRELSDATRTLVAAQPALRSPLLEASGPVAVVVVTADRGLCGAYNANVIRAFERRRRGGDVGVVVGVGRKFGSWAHFRGVGVDHQIDHVTHQPTYQQALRLFTPLIAQLEEGVIGGIDVISNRFYSLGSQRTEVTHLAPMRRDDLLDGTESRSEVETDPDLAVLTEVSLRDLIVAEGFGLLLEASAAEHAARQRAMKTATDNANELVRTLTRAMNRARQDAITTEIAEIVGGAEALATAGALKKESELL
ncbi:ATP synthase F1, gamma subunit [Acidimicrobium ferrooxidans DSM 10331]|uniref:ATP synthase gamma chain n=1 Tax=Acidimicrobium ferrooxidans (strain DSM 10331 / JCM 15462 / NBRC 103882 / ICP) TaxID=525909 RepID=C7M162_ACIFD|nr:ATP synthase F1 subunit gamma [Acidimicrobium ferrooxidans]ACU54710.1 ATP synthase F1, gamma subunit [Acidimicrobium ferrooxidans DSM 10331]